MQQALFKCETPQLELKSLQTFLAIKCCQRTKIGKVINLAQSSLNKVTHVWLRCLPPLQSLIQIASLKRNTVQRCAR